MARASQGISKNQRSSRGVTAAVAVFLALGWVWLVAGTRLHEMMVGAGVVVVSTLYLKTVHESSRSTFRLQWKDIVQGWRIPWYMVSDTWVVTLTFIRDLLHLRPAGSYFRASSFECSKRDPVIQGRGVLATIFLTSTPNVIVLGIDPESNRMLFHQLQRAPVPQMARALGSGS
jgi:hypothetical protein